MNHASRCRSLPISPGERRSSSIPGWIVPFMLLLPLLSPARADVALVGSFAGGGGASQGGSFSLVGAIDFLGSGAFSGGPFTLTSSLPLAGIAPVLPGDLDGNGTFTPVEFEELLRVYLGTVTATARHLAVGDMRPEGSGGTRGDGAIRGDDVNWLYRHLLGLESVP